MKSVVLSNRKKVTRKSIYSKSSSMYKCLLLFVVIFLTVGYAYLNTSLNINGVNRIENNRWDVHFENITKVDGSIDATSEATITGDTAVDFTIDLRLPGDVYSFTVDVVNDGTIDAMLNEVLKTGLTTEQEAYVDYTVTYSDGEEILEKDSLPGGKQDTLLVSVKYKDDIEADDLPSENQTIELTLQADYIQDDGTSTDRRPPKRLLYNEIIAQNQENGIMVLDNQSSTYVSASTGIDFKTAPSDTNGKGVYVRNGTESDTYPIYYYRGAVTNNNVLFANFCWKIVRTTETGGIKLIYNGTQKEVFDNTPIESSEYTNVTNDATYAYTYDSTTKNWTSTNKTDSATGTITLSVATAGYYAINYVVSSESNYDKAYFYLDDVLLGEYSGEISGSISLGEITSSNVITVKYTKDSSSASGSDTVSFNVGLKTGTITKSCDNTGVASQIGTTAFNSSNIYNAYVGYMYGTPNSSTYDAEHLSTKESTSSRIKVEIDSWFEDNMTGYTSYLEDTVWCNDRSFASSNTGTGAGTSVTDYGAYERNYGSSMTGPSLECTNQNDRFTVNATMEGRVNGNGALTYPVALLTADELTLAGNGNQGYSSSSYLTTGQDWWSLSPYRFYSSFATEIRVGSAGSLSNILVRRTYGARPSVSLLLGTEIESGGDGSTTNPFVVK